MKKLTVLALLASTLFLGGCEHVVQTLFFATTGASTPVAIGAEPYRPPSPTTVTLILGGGDKIVGYEGTNIQTQKIFSYSNKNSLQSFLKEMKQKHGDKLVFFIKPGANASYKNTINILDEMVMNEISKYNMVKLSPEEESIAREKINK